MALSVETTQKPTQLTGGRYIGSFRVLPRFTIASAEPGPEGEPERIL